MTKLSVVIVNYNVKHFIEQCLFSVLKASENIACEVFVVDNNSVDGSVTLIKEKFPQVNLIVNKTNTGFSVANNQALKIAKGEYVLLLNPDTVVQEDTFSKILAFMDEHPDAGGLGVKMLDGQGNFAPESKRGLPTPEVAFYKMFGFSRFFPKSKRFGKYHLSYLSEDELAEIDVMSGAFMLIRKTVLDKIGFLDETFFMYGEDIDLSYRIKKAGYKNYYFPDTQIIHYKGESTKRSSLNYVVIFYKAMAIFSNKHFSGSNAFWFNALIHLAIFLKASLALLSRFFKAFTVPMIDFGIITFGLFFIKNIYQQKTGIDGDIYSEKLLSVAFPLYATAWVVMVYFNGGYDKPIKILKIIRGVLVGTVFILMGYSLLPESLRFSRALILLGTSWAMVCFVLTRLLYHVLKFKTYSLSSAKTKRIAIIGEEQEFNRVSALLKQTQANPGFVGFVSAEINGVHNPYYIGKINQIDEIIKVHQINEIIFCAKDISSQFIINNMLTLVSSGVDFKIAPPESLSIIGSNDVDTAGDLYVIDVNSVSKSNNKRNKRLLDIGVSILAILFSPVLLFIQENKSNYFLNCFNVLFGFYSWVGYGKITDRSLPEIKRSVLYPAMLLDKEIDSNKIKLANLRYAKDYNIEKDILIIWKCRKQLGS
ncbi:MAG TPA: glycosyltransferase family 2 protein [Bacteroidia bacterium]|nr:glycosyltransferase family 2 protein [Bacteroidia bacterium]